MRLPDNFFRDRSPAEIIAKVATIQLSNISLLGSEELKRIGWLDNPIIDILYSLTSAGVWIARTDASGRVTESNSANQLIYETIAAYMLQERGIAAPTTTSAIAALRARRIGVRDITLVNGVANDQSLVAALAGYYGVIELIGLYSSAALDGGDLTAAFQDEDNNALTGAPASMTLACIPTAITKTIEGIILYSGTDNKALEVDIDSGGGAADNAKHVYLLYYYWYET